MLLVKVEKCFESNAQSVLKVTNSGGEKGNTIYQTRLQVPSKACTGEYGQTLQLHQLKLKERTSWCDTSQKIAMKLFLGKKIHIQN